MTSETQNDPAASAATSVDSLPLSEPTKVGVSRYIITEGAVLGFGGLIPFGIFSILVAFPAMILPGIFGQSQLMANPSVGLGVILICLMSLGFFTAFILSGYAEVEKGADNMSWSAALSRALDVFWPVLALLLIKLVAFAIGGLLLIIPAFILWGLLSISCSLLVLDNLSIKEALRTSIRLTQKYRWQLAGIQIVKLFILFLPAIIISNIFGAIFADHEAIEAAREARTNPPQPFQGFLMLAYIYLVFAAAFEAVTYRWLKKNA